MAITIPIKRLIIKLVFPFVIYVVKKSEVWRVVGEHLFKIFSEHGPPELESAYILVNINYCLEFMKCILETYLEFSQTSVMEYFCENS